MMRSDLFLGLQKAMQMHKVVCKANTTLRKELRRSRTSLLGNFEAPLKQKVKAKTVVNSLAEC